ncbi:MAG: FAD-dependent oxidoreductase [Pseudomonadota bacterium]
MNKSFPIVVIGGGAIGLSVAYHLGLREHREVFLLERNRLTSGTSWHAAGICGPLRSSYNLTVLARYGVELFARLESETGQATGFLQTGGMWLAQSDSRMTELRRLHATAGMHGLHAEILQPPQIIERFAHMNTHDLSGAVWVDEDAQINPVDLCMAYARGARNMGVTIREHAGVASIERKERRIIGVTLTDGEFIEASSVINCAGLWSRQIGQMANVQLPLHAVEHMYIVTEPISDLASPCPVIRDLDSGIYIKGDAGKLVLGQFESNATLWDPEGQNPDIDFLEFPENWELAEPMFQAGIHRVPAFADHGISRFMNGPESFTPDTRQLMGRIPGFDNFFVACGFNSIGVMSSAGVGKVMADWVLDGAPPMDLWDVDVQRMLPGDGDADFLRTRIPESVHNQFAMHWPYKQFKTGRNRKRSVWHEEMAAHGAVFGAPTGWERPLYFAKTPDEKTVRYSYGPQGWWSIADRESKNLQTAGALFELSPFTKIDISGSGSLQSLQNLCCNAIDIPIGRVVYTLMLNESGGIETEGTLSRKGTDHWRLTTGAATRVRDIERLTARLPDTLLIEDVTERECVLGVMGPNSRQLMSELVDQPNELNALPFSHFMDLSIKGHTVRVVRLSYVGELGYELYIENRFAAAVFSAVVESAARFNITLAGHYCLDSCRLEKGYLHWGHDIGTDDDPISAGLGFAVTKNHDIDYIGKQAIKRLRSKPTENRLQLFEVHDTSPLLLHDEPVYFKDECVGRTTSGGLGFRTGKPLCMAYVPRSIESKEQWFVDIGGERFEVTPLPKAPYDPDGRRMKS